MKKILIVGAARSGAAAANLLLDLGYDVVLTDNRNTEAVIKEFPQVADELPKLAALSQSGFETVFGEQFPADRAGEFDFIVTSPGVPWHIPVFDRAEQLGIPVISEPELAYRLTKTPFTAITGTNGKTTTTTLTGEIFKASGRATFVVGNIGDAICAAVEKAKPEDIFVTEIGAFQLARSYNFKPHTALVLNISPDHLDRFVTMENYIAAKERIYMNMTAEDVLVLNADDPVTAAMAANSPVKKVFISLKQDVPDGAVLDGDTLVIKDDGKRIALVTTDELGIKGPHNIQNALGASALAYFDGVALEAIRKALISFKGVEHRQEPVCTKRGVQYINDSKGTNTDATITALRAMNTPVVLIAGGYDKKENYDLLSQEAAPKLRALVLIGVTADAIEKSMRAHGVERVLRADTLEQAVSLSAEAAQPGDTVLLSPACASWGMFDNYEIRGQQFKEFARRLAD